MIGMKINICIILSILILFFPSVDNALAMQHQNMPLADVSNFFSETYFVGTLDSSVSHQTSGEYDVTVFYPSSSSGSSSQPDRTGAPYPAIVFAHGFACTKDDYSWIGNYCATHGYVSILFTTPSQFDFFSAFPQSAEGFSLAIDYLTILNREEGGLLEGMIDEEMIGVMGHSMGAMAALEATANDTRIKAVVSLAPGYFDFLSFSDVYLEACKSIVVPTQLILGSEDTICLPSGARNYYDALSSEKELLIINGTFHDLGIWNAGNEPDWLGLIPGYDPVKQEYYRNTTTRYFISWFNYYLYNYSDYQPYIYGNEAWSDLEFGVLSDLETSRGYTIIVVDDQYNPVKDVEVTLYRQDGTVLWNAFTDASGATQFNLSLTPLNYTHRLYLEATKGDISLSEEIDIPHINLQPNFVVIPEFSTWQSVLLVFMVITVALVIYKLKFDD
jgi:pimeloyl-ACP methyl ester carboxylesterase